MSPKRGTLPNVGWHLLAWMLFITTGISHAALPPQYQNEKDLDVIIVYIKANPEVLSGLQAIDLGSISFVFHSFSIQRAFKSLLIHLPFVFHGCFPGESRGAY